MRGGDSSNIYAHIAQVDGCYGLLCELGINGLINSMSRMINNYWKTFSGWLPTPRAPQQVASFEETCETKPTS